MKPVVILSVVCLALVACTREIDSRTDGRETPATATATSRGGETYHDLAGWTIEVPPGWHVVPFETSKGNATATGAQVSNVELPSPTIVPGYPIQALGSDLPADGIALIIAVDEDPGDVQRPPQSPRLPPLSLDQFLEGSSPGGSPTLSLLWFSGNGQTFLATIKNGSESTSEDRTALEALVASLRFSEV